MEGLQIYLISSRKQPTRGGPPAWLLGEVLTTPRRKNVYWYEMFTQKNWLRKGTGGGHLRRRQWTSGFHKFRGTFWL